jgi:hypothetical protein
MVKNTDDNDNELPKQMADLGWLMHMQPTNSVMNKLIIIAQCP